MTQTSQTMRRIIAEDPEWNLATVPDLSKLCLNHIIHNFKENPIITELEPRDKSKVLHGLDVKIPLSITANLIEDEGYWRRCCEKRWSLCDVSQYAHNWKRMFLEKNLQEIVEKFVPVKSDVKELLRIVKLSENFIERLDIKQLLPPIKEMRKNDEDETSDNESEDGDPPECDHLDLNILLKALPKLQQLHLVYGVSECGMNFEWNLFEFTLKDCMTLAKAVKDCSTLKLFHLSKSKVDDEKARILITNLLDHPSLEKLDLSYNKLGDSAARAVGKLLNGHSRLTHLDLTNNHIHSPGAAAIAHALGKSDLLKVLNLRLNRIEDDGCQSICKALLKNQSLADLHLGSNNITENSAKIIAQVILYNKSLEKLNLSCNTLNEKGGHSIQEAMEENSCLMEVDLRMCELSMECLYSINQLLTNNKRRKHKKL